MQTRHRSPRERQSTKAVEDSVTVRRLTTLAQDRPRYGCKRLYAVYEREADDGDSYMPGAGNRTPESDLGSRHLVYPRFVTGFRIFALLDWHSRRVQVATDPRYT
jgi:hypothetical protein